ncbi:MAG TPA: sortase, partial [Anaerolineales bacterium]|nr:sortase [Anaerolineales bacterium]
TATATAQDADTGGNTVTSNQSSVTVHLEALSLIKSTTTSSYKNANDKITYNYTLTNTGSLTLYSPFNISDDHIGSPLGTPFACGSVTSLAPNANITCSKTYTVLAADVTAGSVTNTATATAKDAASGGNTVNSNSSNVTVYAVVAPTISKAFSPSTIPVGTTSTLTFTITNPAPNSVPLTGIGFTDTFPSGMVVGTAPDSAQCGGTVTSTSNSITLSGGSIIPNSSCTVTVKVIGTTNGNLNNTSDAVSSTNGGTGDTASATLNVVSPPAISKSFSPIETYVGSTSTLTFTLTAPSGNTVALTGVAFTDNLPSGLQVAGTPNATTSAGCGTPTFPPAAGNTTITFSNGTLAVGGTCTITVNVTPTSAGTFNNTTNAITSTNGGTGATSNTATLTADQAVDLSITKTDGKLAVDRAEAITYTIVVSNAGPSAATGASVFDTIPSSLTSVTWTCAPGAGASCAASGSGNISDTVTIPAGSNVTYSVSATVSNSAATDIVNSASVIAPVGVTDTNTSNNSATDTDHLNLLNITKSANPTTYSTVGTVINYSYTVTNNGTSTLSPTFTVADDKVPPICTAPATLAPTESFTCAAAHTITQADLDAGSITNNVSATAKDADGDTVTSNTATKIVTATQSPSLNLTKSVTSGNPYDTVGGSVGYSYVVKNDGNVTLTSPFAVSDNKVTVTCPPTASLAPNATITCTAAYTVTQNDLDVGSVTNTASATGYFGTTLITSSTASQTVNATQNKGLTLVKSITSGNPYTAAGDTINYSYLLTNNGNVTLTGNGAGNVFTVTDDKTTVTCPATPTSLAPGDTVTCTSTYTVVAGDLGSSVVNHATAHALFGSTPVNSNQDTQTAYGSPVLAITKDDGVQIVAPNAQPEYTITVTNNSLQDSTGLQLVDTIPNGTSFVSATNGGTFNSGTSQVTWPSFDLAAGASTQFKVKVQVEDLAQLQADNITSITNQVHVQDDGTHSAGTPVQASASDTDQISFNGVKNLTGTEQAGSTTPNVLIGEILDYSINIDIPNGTINDLQAVDVLDHGLAFVGCDLTTPMVATNLNVAQNPCTDPTALTVQAEPITDVDPASDNAGRHITFDFGQVQNTSGSTQTLTLNYRVIVLDIKDNLDGVTNLKNHVEWVWAGGTLSGSAEGVNITEPKLEIEKTVSPGVAALGTAVTYTIDVSHATASSAPAYDVTVTDNIPTGLTLDQTSVAVSGSAGLPSPVINTTSTLLTVSWSEFPLGAKATVTFNATFVGPPPVENSASVDWSSLQIDPNPHLQPQSTYNQHSTERRYDPSSQTINDYRVQASATLGIPHSPGTGFAPNQVTLLPIQSKDKAYQNLGDLWLEIPKLGVKIPIVGVPLDSQNEWDLTWLSEQAGYLNGTAYPTHAGNSVLTGHVYLANGVPGPFFNLSKLRYGDQIIVHLAGQSYIYQVRENRVVSPKDISVFKHQDYPWLTLVTCKDYDASTNTYLYRVAVGAVLVNIQNDSTTK